MLPLLNILSGHAYEQSFSIQCKMLSQAAEMPSEAFAPRRANDVEARRKLPPVD